MSLKKKVSLKSNGFVLDETDKLAPDIIACRKCPRVLTHCRAVADKEIMRRTVFANEIYWGRPVPNFGRLPAKLLIVGLAPGAHGSNRTSRMFTGDDSGLWLYRALHKAGFATTANCTKVGDNKLIDCSITSVTHCAPPGNKPTPEEIRNCKPFLETTIRDAAPRVIIALGSIAWKNTLQALGASAKTANAFKHGSDVTLEIKTAPDQAQSVTVIASYHVSRQNTNTGRLTEPMLDAVFSKARRLADQT